MTRPTLVRNVLLGVLLVALTGFGAYRLLRAEIELVSEPAGGLVRLNGEAVGRTPMTLTPPTGRQRVTVELAGYATIELPLDVQAGQREEYRLAFVRGTGQLELLSNPRDAWVSLDGERIEGRTPITLEHPSGPVEVAVGRDERRTVTQRVVVEDGRTVTVRAELERDPHGSLTVRVVPSDARVRLPDLDIAYVPGVRLPAGSQTILLERDGYHPLRTTVSIVVGENRPRFALEPLVAPLTLRLSPPQTKVDVRWLGGGGGRRSLDGGATVELPVGDVRFRARAMGHRVLERRVAHGVDGTTVELRLEPIDVAAGTEISDPLRSGGRAPTMIVVPAGRVVMGADDGPPSQRPAVTRVFTAPFAVSRNEVTVAEYRRFASATGVEVDERVGEDAWPVRFVDHAAATAYAAWLSEQTGERYRLPTEAQWEYVARAGTTGERYFGTAEICEFANLADLSTAKRYGNWDVEDCDDGFATVAPVGSFTPNDFGIHDMLGNVAEWVRECGVPDYARAPEDGGLALTGPSCRMHGTRGGSWDGNGATLLVGRRTSNRGARDDVGIRLVREL